MISSKSGWLNEVGGGLHASADYEAAKNFPEKLADIVGLEGRRLTSAKLAFSFFDRNTLTSLHCKKKKNP